MKQKSLIIEKKAILISCIFMLFYTPKEYAVGHVIYTFWRYLSATISFLIVLVYILKSIKSQIDFKRYSVIVLYLLWMFVGSSLHSKYGEIKLMNFILSLGFCTFILLLFNIEEQRIIIKSYIIAGLTMSLIHFISFIIYRDIVGGMRHGASYEMGGGVIGTTKQHWYFLTYDNDSIYYFIPIIVLLFYYSYRYNHKVYKIFFSYNIILISMFISQLAAACSITMLFVCTGYIYIYFHRRPRRFRSIAVYWKSILLGLFINILPIFILNSNIIALIASFFSKRSNLGRNQIWSLSLHYIGQNLFLGQGHEPRSMTVRKIYQTHCHNTVIEHLYVGGIFGLVLFIILLISFRPRKQNPPDFSIAIFSIGIIAYFMTGAVDWLLTNHIPLAVFLFNSCINSYPKLDHERITKAI